MLRVDKNRPIPEKKRGASNKYPFKDLKVGDSFLIPDKSKKKGVYSCLASFNKRQSVAIKITIRIEANGIRVWRIPNIKK